LIANALRPFGPLEASHGSGRYEDYRAALVVAFQDFTTRVHASENFYFWFDKGNEEGRYAKIAPHWLMVAYPRERQNPCRAMPAGDFCRRIG
jgi:hypothetical protein